MPNHNAAVPSPELVDKEVKVLELRRAGLTWQGSLRKQATPITQAHTPHTSGLLSVLSSNPQTNYARQN